MSSSLDLFEGLLSRYKSLGAQKHIFRLPRTCSTRWAAFEWNRREKIFESKFGGSKDFAQKWYLILQYVKNIQNRQTKWKMLHQQLSADFKTYSAMLVRANMTILREFETLKVKKFFRPQISTNGWNGNLTLGTCHLTLGTCHIFNRSSRFPSAPKFDPTCRTPKTAFFNKKTIPLET